MAWKYESNHFLKINLDIEMKPESKQLGVIGHNVVIDNGTNTVKGGFSTADAPQCRIPTIVGHGRHKVSICLL